ncbi:endonuclease/exonuclease/phosphatase (EEP) superfamily protein YafD [Mesorhizobium sp. J18]|nr:endonuclease/exonuclease/phosphatase (EEP) superfamily protein YafD [Mesorhizobium sp. J18]
MIPVVIAGMTVAAAFALMAGFLGWMHPALDSFSHFRIHLAVLLILAGSCLLLAAGWRLPGAWAILLGLAAIVATLDLSAFTRPAEATAASAAEPSTTAARYRLLQINLRYDNATPERVLSLIGRVQADVVTLDEVSTMWIEKLGLIEAAYPHRIICPPPSFVGGVAILSKRPFAKEAQCLDRGALAVASVDFGGRLVDVAALHLSWPWPLEQAQQVANIRDDLGRISTTALLAGDFNAVPWSHTAKSVANAGGFNILRGIGSSWLHRYLPMSWRPHIGLPLDNVLYKGAVIPSKPSRLEFVGSDHLPVLVEFGLLREEEPAEVMQASVEEPE